MADVNISITIPDALVSRSVDGLTWHYGLENPTVQELKDYIEADIYEWIAKQVARYEGSVAGDAAHSQCLDDFGIVIGG